MFYLIGSIVFTSWLTISLKLVDRLKISTLQSIVWNYIFCVITGSIVSGTYPMNEEVIHAGIWKWSILVGLMFIVLFNVIAFTAQRMGVAAASVSNKLSLVIPFLFSLFLWGDQVTIWKVLGIVLALFAVFLTCMPSGGFNSASDGRKNYFLWVLPLVLFIGSGLLDTLIKYVQQEVLKSGDANGFLISAFAMAALGGVILTAFRFVMKTEKWTNKSILAGLMIGVPNYASIWCLIEVLKRNPDSSSVVIPVNNIGIVLFSTLAARVLFKEKLTGLNWVGIAIASGAILLIAFG
jgi:drug/metabolite transporter (DMT)-like permease